MIKTKGDFVSEIRNHLKSLNKDDYIPARFIISTAETFIQYLINTRPLSNTMRALNSFTMIECIEMERVKSHKCDIAEFRTAEKIMKSKKPLPNIFTNSKIGYIIESILNIDYSTEYKPLRTPKDFKNTKNRQFGGNSPYYYISNNYIYILNSTSEIITINALFQDENEALQMSDCKEDCYECRSKLEEKFVCPEEYISTVRDQTLQLLLGANKRVVEDENPDLDSNQKSRTN